jgi:hypothetical protein
MGARGDLLRLMEILERISQSLTAKGRLLKDLAALAGRMQGLVDRLERHGAACVYPQMKVTIEEVAQASTEHLKTLNSILSDNNVRAKLPERPVHEGINNWERISGDRVALGRLNVDLNQQSVRWLAVDAVTSERLRTIVNEQIALIAALQELAARSDPQAID